MSGPDPIIGATDAVRVWSKIYTFGLPTELAEARRAEVLSDLHDHVAWAHEHGDDPRATARTIRGRALRGALSDVTWAMSVDTPLGSWRRFDRLLVGVLAALALAMIGIAAVVLARPGEQHPVDHAATAAVGAAIGLGALALLARRRTRAFGALWIIAAAQIELLDGVDQVVRGTTILALAAGYSSAWPVGVALADVGVSLLCVTAALWWAPETRARGMRGGPR